MAKTFKEKVFSIVRLIPKGKILTYKQIAIRAGRPLAYRAVGNILNSNYDHTVPCHRVIRSDGGTGGWNRGEAKKKKLLENEKVGITK